ncbi:MAG: hypothetical protein EP329_09035 [Deltaproteobacteria bacterium]|nr:MAG: hypothetical protein EP329_09035 [Deltaproteobacteria bacterium]
MLRTTLITALTALLITPTAAHALTVLGDGRIQLTFTTPGVSAETALDPDADDAVIALIDGAAATLDVCLYDFNHAGLVDAITAAADRGVAVRFVGDADEADQSGYLAMDAAGIPTTLRVGGAIMHDKFVVVDGRFVATGSMNYSDAGVFRNNNNVLLVDDAQLAADYTTEFEQMFVGGAFGRSKVAFARTPVTLGQTRIDVAFSPADDPELVLEDTLATAQHAVYFMIYSFTREELAAQLIAAKQAGVDVVGIYDSFGATNAYSTDETLAAAGVPVLLDGNENQIGASGGKLHHKVMIIDPGTENAMVVTGSFNWSDNASHDNDENLVILRGPEAIGPFMTEFCDVFDAALPHPANTVALPDPCGTDHLGIDDGTVGPTVLINELLPNPDGTDTPEEYVELVNVSDAIVDLSGWHLGDAADDARHVFAAGTTLEPGAALVVYGGANAAEPERLVASTGNLSLNNASETVHLFDAAGALVDSVTTGSATSGVAFNRVEDGVGGQLVLHTAIAPTGAAMSPGLRADGTPWLVPGQALVVLNELLPNPTGTDLGQEYVELVNMGVVAADLSGWRLGDAASDSRHVFAAGTVLEPGHALVVFDRGDHSAIANAINASTETLSLNNSGETVTLYDADGVIVDAVTWTSASEGVAFNRATDGDPGAAFVDHDLAAGATGTTSPGLRVDGSTWGDAPVVEPPVVEEPPAPVPTAMSVTWSGAIAQGAWLDFGSFDAVEGSFVVTLTGTGDADLYVRQGAAPTLDAWDCRPWAWGSDESCTLTAPGTFHVAVYGYAAADFTITISYVGLADAQPAATGAADVVIASLLADPNGTDLGHEYVVLENRGDADADLSGWTLSDASSVRHTFADGTVLAAGASLVLFDRGDHGDALVTSTGTLSLNNGGDTLTLLDAAGTQVDALTYAAVSAGQIVERAE